MLKDFSERKKLIKYLMTDWLTPISTDSWGTEGKNEADAKAMKS